MCSQQSLHGAPHQSNSARSSGNSSYQPSCDPQTHSNPTIPPSPVLPYYPSPHQQPHLPYPLPYHMTQQTDPYLALQHGYIPPPFISLYPKQQSNVPSYQTTVLLHSPTRLNSISLILSHDGPGFLRT